MSALRLCPTPECGKPSRPDRRACYACHQARWRARNPVRAALATLTDHARARGIPCDLSSHEWAHFCEQTGCIERRGLSAGDLTVDRHDAEAGYTITNLRPLTRSENSVKWNVTDKPRRFGGGVGRPVRR